MFAILFSVGTSYFLFLGSTNGKYANSLVSASNRLQSAGSEGLQVTPLLGGNGHIEFYVNNTSGVTINMTLVYVLASSGGMLKCDGIGLPAGAGCGNTTPALPAVVNSGKGYPGSGSGTVDTGYAYTSGTVSVKVVTARGNVFSATYPAPVNNQVSNQIAAKVAVSVGSLLINQQSFRFYSSATNNLGDGYIVSGYDAFAIPSAAKTAFSLTLTNDDPQGRGITLNQKSVLSTGGAPSTTTFYIVRGITDSSPYTSGVTLTAYSQSSPISLAYGATTTLYFAASQPSGTGVVSSPSSGPYGIFLLMYGQYSDNTYYSQTIPFEATYSTGATITGSTLSGCAGTTYSESLQSSTWSSGPAAYYVPTPSTGAGTLITVGTPTTSSVSFKIPSGTAQGYYQVFFDDGVNIAYMTFHITC